MHYSAVWVNKGLKSTLSSKSYAQNKFKMETWSDKQFNFYVFSYCPLYLTLNLRKSTTPIKWLTPKPNGRQAHATLLKLRLSSML